MKDSVKLLGCLVVVGILLGLIVGCGQQGAGGTDGVDESSAATVTMPSPAEVAGATLSGIYDDAVTLVEGEYEGEPFEPEGASRPRVHLITELMPHGDLNGDGVDEVIALVSENSGGTGHFLYVVPMTTIDGVVQQLGSALVGDRVNIRSVDVKDGTIVMQTIEGGPGDAACCPTHKGTRVWTMQDGVLTETVSEIEGPFSLADLAGPEWVLKAFNNKETAPETPEVTLRFDLEENKFVGSGGCNSYFGSVESSEPRSLTIGPLAGTMMMCPPEVMDVETRYLKALGGAEGYGFYLGRMAINYPGGEEYGVLLFEAREVEATE